MNVGVTKRARGCYILLVALPWSSRISVGALGALDFYNGFYAYVGSAMGGLRGRINRHLRRVKRVRWHIDYLLEKGKVKEVIYAPTSERLECRLAQSLEKAFRSFPGFGSSDCRCPSHLFFSKELQALQGEVVVIFRDVLQGGEPLIERF